MVENLYPQYEFTSPERMNRKEQRMKPGVFTQLYVQLIFSPKYRERLLIEDIRPEVFRYISGIITKRKNKSIILNGTADHVHILLRLNPDDKISDIVATVKRSSSLFINEKGWFNKKFHWQDGYGGFSYGKSQIDRVYNYILQQEKHHKKRTFREEYIEILKKFDIAFENQYLFEFFD